MLQSKIKKNWTEIKKRLKKQYAYLTEDDIYFDAKDEGDFLKNLQHKIGISREELIYVLYLFNTEIENE